MGEKQSLAFQLEWDCNKAARGKEKLQKDLSLQEFIKCGRDGDLGLRLSPYLDLRSRIMLRTGDGRETKLTASFGVGMPKTLSTEDFFVWD